MNEIDRHTDPRDNGWHAAQAITLIGICALAIWAAVGWITCGKPKPKEPAAVEHTYNTAGHER